MSVPARISTTGHVPFVDGLRAVAVLSVIAFHLGVPGTGGGYVGVDIFLVISGFLITGQIIDGTYDGRFRYSLFYARRVLRILPPLFIVVVFSLIAAELGPFLGAELRS